MSLDRFEYESGAPCDVARAQERGALDALDAARAELRRAALAFGMAVKAASPAFIDRWEHATRRTTMSHDEAITGFAELIDETARENFLDTDAILLSREIADGGEQ